MARINVPMVLIVLSLAGGFELSAQTPGSNSNEKHTTLYLFDPEMDFLQIDLQLFSMRALWSLPLVSKLADVLPSCDVRSGCIVARDYRYDGRGHLFAVFPKRQKQDSEKGAEGATPAGTYQVVGLRLPDFEVLGQLDVPQPQAEAPNVLLSPDGLHLYVEYRDSKAQQAAKDPIIVVVLDVNDARTFKTQTSIRQSAPVAKYLAAEDALDALFSGSAYFSSDGQYIFDGLNRIQIKDNQAKKETVNPIPGLTDVQRKALTPYVKTVAGKPYFDFNVAESAGGRTVVWMSDEKRTKYALWTTDLRTGADSPVIISPFGFIHLVEDGTKIVVEESAGRAKEGTETLKTGRILTFDVDSGKQTGDFSNEALKGALGEHRSICMSSDGSLLVEVTKQNILLVDLKAEKVKTLPVKFPANPGTTCLFAEQ
jgi:hypothetical protein